MFISLLLDQTTSTSFTWFDVSPLNAQGFHSSLPLCQPKSSPNPGTAILSESCLYPLWGQISMPKGAASHMAVSVVAEAGKGLGKRMWQTQPRWSCSCMTSVTLMAWGVRPRRLLLLLPVPCAMSVAKLWHSQGPSISQRD